MSEPRWTAEAKVPPGDEERRALIARYVATFRGFLKECPDATFVTGVLAAALAMRHNKGEAPQPAIPITRDGIPTGENVSFTALDQTAHNMVKRWSRIGSDAPPWARALLMDAFIDACRQELKEVHGLETRIEWLQ